MRRREEGRLRNPRGRLSLEREAGGTPGMGWDTGGMVSGDTRETGGERHCVDWC